MFNSFFRRLAEFETSGAGGNGNTPANREERQREVPLDPDIEWRTGRSFTKAIQDRLPSEESLTGSESKQALAILRRLPDEIAKLPYPDYQKLVAMAFVCTDEYHKHCGRFVSFHRDAEMARSQLKDPTEQKLQELLQRQAAELHSLIKAAQELDPEFLSKSPPKTITERLSELLRALEGDEKVHRRGLEVLSP
ncbi:MAG: hypothetical protein EBZ48_13225, partial [Proteobacteria bacterium]|nr:hypothetical protein [Pseudomonadota bacterium]